MSTLDLDLFQFSPELGKPAANARRIAERARASAAGLFVTPELSLTGYDLGDEAADLARPLQVGAAFPGDDVFEGLGPKVVVGLPELGRTGVTYNSLAVIDDGLVRFRHRKLYLPTYGMFDEARFFGRGEGLQPFELGEWRIGFLVCEDFWHPGLTWILAASGIDVLVVAAAAPGRGGPAREDGTGPSGHGKRFASMAAWERIARATAQVYGVYVALVNRCGVEGAVTFGGGSLIVAPDGDVITGAGGFDEVVLSATLSRGAVHRARRPASHSRDEDLRLMRSLVDGLDA